MVVLGLGFNAFIRATVKHITHRESSRAQWSSKGWIHW